MHVLFPTGRQSEEALKSSLAKVTKFTYEIVVTGEIASFLTPTQLEKLISCGNYDCVVVSGMCTASFEEIDNTADVKIFRGTRHASDMSLCEPLIISGSLSKTKPADELLTEEKKKNALEKLVQSETEADFDFEIRGVKFGKSSRIKVVCEIMDAHTCPNLREKAIAAFDSGADAVDLGFGFDACEADVIRCFEELEDLPFPLSVDTLNPDLIRAALFRADIVFSLTKKTISVLADAVKKSGAVCVLISRDGNSLEETVALAKAHGLTKILADPLLLPPLSKMTESLAGYTKDYGISKVLGCVNVIELTDADSVGMCALLASVASETDCSAVLISEHSDKTSGACFEMRRATEIMALSKGRPYPKDAGIDLFVIKEKRKRHEPSLVYDEIRDAPLPRENLVYDKKGSFRIGIENGYVVAVRHGKAIRGKTWYEVFSAILEEEGVSLLDHAGYLGKELYKAELALRFGRSFEQDGEF
ncbi:MAG: dihydropteroate synthase [Methanocorpusculum sp.]|nr:dihydropteroate synthase [Methanocorpusculum sp.]